MIPLLLTLLRTTTSHGRWTTCLAFILVMIGSITKINAQQQVDLPPPTQWAVPTGLPTAPGDALNVTFTGSAPVAQAPVVAAWNLTAAPGESFTLTGSNFTLNTGSVAGSDTQVLLWGYNSSGGTLITLQTSKVSANLIMASVPSTLPFGVYFVWVENSAGPSAPVILNNAQATWIGPMGNTATAGSTKRVFGTNLSTALGEVSSYVYLRPSGSIVAPTACTVTKVEPNAVWFTVPTSLSTGNYDVFVHNGHGGSYGWSTPQTLTVQTAWVRGSNVVSLNPVGGDNTAALNAAINTAAGYTNGGTVSLAAGTFQISGTVTIQSNVALVGAGATQTTILGETGGKVIFAASGNHIALENLSLQADVGVSPFYVYSGSVSGGNYNQDLLIQNVNFNVSSDAVSNITVGDIEAQRLEITGCTFNGALHGAPIDWWVHNNDFHGGRTEQDGAIQLGSDISVIHGGLVLENCTAETPSQTWINGSTGNWPVGPGGSVNYYTFLSGSQLTGNAPTGSIWCSRFVNFAAGESSINYTYIGHNTTTNVALDGANKGEQILFHSSEALAYAQISSNSGTTLTIRTDGSINGNSSFVLNPVSAGPAVSPFTSVPNKIMYGTTIDNNAYVILVDGAGKGQINQIVSHTGTTITVAKPWRVSPDATTLFMIDYIYLGEYQYKNNLNAFPNGYVVNSPPGDIASSQAIDYDGNTFYSVAEGNTNNNTVFGDNLNGYLLAPSYWNEFRSETSTGAFCTGIQINSRGGDWTGSPTSVTTLGDLCLGDWVRSSQSNNNAGFEDIVGGWGTLPANKPFIEGCGFENGTIGSTMTAYSYDPVLLRNNLPQSGVTPQLLLAPYATPVLVNNSISNYYQVVRLNGGFVAGTRVGNGGTGTLSSGFEQLPLAPYRVVSFDGTNLGSTVTVPVANAGILDMTWTATPSQSWIVATPVTGTTSVGSQQTTGQLQISINTATLPAGFSSGYVTAQSGAFSTTIGVEVDNSLLIADSFNYGSNPISLTTSTTALNGGIGLSGSWALASQNGNNHATYLPTGLTFANLVTSGGAIRSEGQWAGSSLVSRQVATSATGTIYGSFLISPGTRSNTTDPNADTSGMFIGTNGATEYSADLAIDAKGWNSNPATGSVKTGENTGSTVSSGTALTFSDSSPVTYMVLFQVTSLGSPAGTSRTATVWVLTAAQFANFKPNSSTSLTVAALNSATVGTGASNVLQRGTLTNTLAANFDATKFINFQTLKAASSTVWNMTYDELRISGTSLDAVTPVQ